MILQIPFFLSSTNVHHFEFVEIDEELKVIFIEPGIHEIRETMVIPSGYDVIAVAGTILNLLDSAMVISFSPFKFTGDNEYPIVFSFA